MNQRAISSNLKIILKPHPTMIVFTPKSAMTKLFIGYVQYPRLVMNLSSSIHSHQPKLIHEYIRYSISRICASAWQVKLKPGSLSYMIPGVTPSVTNCTILLILTTLQIQGGSWSLYETLATKCWLLF